VKALPRAHLFDGMDILGDPQTPEDRRQKGNPLYKGRELFQRKVAKHILLKRNRKGKSESIRRHKSGGRGLLVRLDFPRFLGSDIYLSQEMITFSAGKGDPLEGSFQRASVRLTN